jgi:Rod binding domain-containing protein
MPAITSAANLPLPQVAPEVAAKARKASQDFEGFFLYQMLEMTAPEPDPNNPFYGGFAEDMFRHSYHEEISKAMVKRGGIGLADTIYAELIRAQEEIKQ